MFGFAKLTALLALVANIFIPTFAHTWIEEYQVIGPNGSYIGDRGYSRGYVARTDPTFEGDANILWLIPPLDGIMPDGTVRLRINSSDFMCHPNQRTSNYSNTEYPMLKAAPGNYVAMKYLENGHVTLPWTLKGKPKKSGTVYVYGTMDPSPNEMVANVMQWNTNGTGGDRRGWLMTTQNFDDDRCHQINDCTISAERQVLFPNRIPDQPTSPGVEQWCETDLKIPENQKPGKLTTYWLWQWPTNPNEECTYPDGKDEYYSTCADFDVIDNSGRDDVKIADEVATNTLVQENFQTRAVSTYSARIAVITSRPIILDDWSKVIGSTDGVRSAFSSACNVSYFSSLSSASAAGFPTAPLPPSCPPGKWATGALFASVSESALAAYKATAKANVAATITTAPASMPTNLATAVPASTPTEVLYTPSSSVATPPPAAYTPAATESTQPDTAPTPSNLDTAYSTYTSTTVLTSFFTVTDTVAPDSAAAESTPTPESAAAASTSVAASGPGAQAPGTELNTITTIGGASDPSTAAGNQPTVAADGTVENAYVGPSGFAGEHGARHRRHVRHFG